MPDASEIQGPRFTLEDWTEGYKTKGTWSEVDYARCGGTEMWIFVFEYDGPVAYVLKQRVNDVYYLYARLRDALALVRSETNYKDVRLTPEQFVQGIAGDFTVPYDMRTQQERENPPKEEGCRQDPAADNPTEDSQESGAS